LKYTRARMRPWTTVLATLISVFLCSSAVAQTAPPREKWSERFNSTGAKLTYRETGRTRVQGATVVTYNLFASGLPRDRDYVLWLLGLGKEPQTIADAYVNPEGKIVNVLADPQRHVAEDPIDLKVAGGKGEPFNFALVSDDDQWQAFTQIIPFPVEESAGPCRLSLVQTAPLHFAVFVKVTGLQPNEELVVDQQSENEGAQTKGKADALGTYSSGIFPYVQGKHSGKARFYVLGSSCKIGVEFRWGQGSSPYQ
jgi:hypothetical protein